MQIVNSSMIKINIFMIFFYLWSAKNWTCKWTITSTTPDHSFSKKLQANSNTQIPRKALFVGLLFPDKNDPVSNSIHAYMHNMQLGIILQTNMKGLSDEGTEVGALWNKSQAFWPTIKDDLIQVQRGRRSQRPQISLYS